MREEAGGRRPEIGERKREIERRKREAVMLTSGPISAWYPCQQNHPAKSPNSQM